MKKWVLGFLMIVTASSAQANVQNLKVSGSVSSKFVSRSDFDLGYNSVNSDFNQDYFLSSVKLNFDADLTDHVAATVQLINEREWGEEGTDGSEIDINLAYVTLREILYAPLTVIIGRQSFSYGNCFIFSTSGAGTNSMDTGFSDLYADQFTEQTGLDAIRATLAFDALTFEVFYGKLARNEVTYVGSGYDDVDVFGADAVYQFQDEQNTKLEMYVFSKRDNSVESLAGSKADTIYVPGLRISTDPMERLNLQLEYAHQSGTYQSGSADDNRTRSADAVQAIVNYSLPILKEYEPLVNYTFTYVSGDQNVGTTVSEVYRGWDPFFEDQGFPMIADNFLSMTNLLIHTLSVEAQVFENVSTKLALTGYWLVDEYDADLDNYREDASYAGSEIDLCAQYQYTEDVALTADWGWFLPGELFADGSRDTAQQMLLGVDVVF